METLKVLEEVQQPDGRNKIFVMINRQTGVSRPRELPDYHRDAAAVKLSDKVPEKLHSHFATAQNLLIYAWFFYPFHMSAQMQALACVEFALRERLQPKSSEEKGLKRMLQTAVKHRLIIDEGFKLFPVAPAENRQTISDGQVRVVKSYSQGLVDILPDMRNNLAHGATTLHEGSPMMLRICADVINQLFETSHALPVRVPEPLSPEEVQKWLHEHIPYRVVAAASMSDIEQAWEPGQLTLAPNGLKSLAFNYAALQGRRAAIRWLIEFIGLKKSRGSNAPGLSDSVTGRHPTDCGIRHVGGVPLAVSDANAHFLGDIWQGCSQAILHPTRNTGHFDIEHANLNQAADLIVNHLQAKLYAEHGLELGNVVRDYCRVRTG